MAIPILGDVVREIGGVVRELVPDADKRAELDVRLAELADRADAREDALLQAQVDVNKTEAASGNIFVAGWRPGFGWIGLAVVGYTYILAPLLKFVCDLTGHIVPLPVLDLASLWPMILGMLGIGGMRSYEKLAGVAGGTLGREPRPVPKEAKNPLTKVLPSWLK